MKTGIYVDTSGFTKKLDASHQNGPENHLGKIALGKSPGKERMPFFTRNWGSARKGFLAKILTSVCIRWAAPRTSLDMSKRQREDSLTFHLFQKSHQASDDSPPWRKNVLPDCLSPFSHPFRPPVHPSSTHTTPPPSSPHPALRWQLAAPRRAMWT